MNQDLKKQFSAAVNYTYLNSAAVSPIPLAAIEAVTSQLNDVAGHGSEHYVEWIATKGRARDLLAGVLSVKSENIAFTRNTSDGIATVANGLDWAEGDNIVSFAGEFPANFYPWRRVRDQYGVELRLCPEREGRIDQDELISLIDGNTRVVAISAIQFASGFRVDLKRLADAAHANGALLVVDVIQALGAQGFDLPTLGVDIAAGASHKWLCAPEGCGFIYLSDEARTRVTPTLTGWISVETPWDFEDREQKWKSSALAWESGTGASALFYGLEQSLKLLTETGLDAIQKHTLELSDHLCELLDSDAYEIISSRQPDERSAIVCIKHRGGLHCNEIAERLSKAKIVVSPRNDRLRIAPHFYNDREDIERLVENLPGI